MPIWEVILGLAVVGNGLVSVFFVGAGRNRHIPPLTEAQEVAELERMLTK